MIETMTNPTIEIDNLTDVNFRERLAKLNPDLASKTLEPSLTIEIKDIRSNLDVDAAAKAGLEASKNGSVDVESVLSMPKSPIHYQTVYSEKRLSPSDLQKIINSFKNQPEAPQAIGAKMVLEEMPELNINKESKEISGLRRAYNNIVSFVRKN
jgi:hypothetical protein